MERISVIGGNPGRIARAMILLMVLFIVGCSGAAVEFKPNEVYALALRQELGQQDLSDEALTSATTDVQAWVEAIFGTPDSPRWESVSESMEGASELVDLDRLRRAAGAISSDEVGQHFGLYREHCVNCHGISGDGGGPAAMLQRPYPRDFRPGVFKFKSTERGQKPLRRDLLRTLRRGIPGSSMPSFASVEEADLEALVDYLVYLSIRGEVERRLLQVTLADFDYGSGRPDDRWLPPTGGSAAAVSAEQESELRAIFSLDDPALRAQSELVVQAELVVQTVRKVVESWITAERYRVFVPEVPTSVLEAQQLTDVELAEAASLYEGQIASCASCHGIAGDGKTKLPADYDDWTKEWTTRLGIDPGDKERLAPFLAAGGFKPKPLLPRHLGLGAFRGGGSPADLYRRIVAGIDGTSMPAVNLLKAPGPTGVTEDQVWLLVRYLNHLGDRHGWEEDREHEGAHETAAEVVEGRRDFDSANVGEKI